MQRIVDRRRQLDRIQERALNHFRREYLEWLLPKNAPGKRYFITPVRVQTTWYLEPDRERT